jgi:hypothetical protein
MMTLAEFASIAEIVAAVGVIVSLLVVAWEIRKNTAQSKQSNWGWLVDRFSTVYAQTDDLTLADLVARGRQSFHALSEGEKIAFGHYLEQLCIANDGLLVFSKSEVYGQEEMMALFEKHMRFHLGFPGAREWWEQFQSERGFPQKTTDAINRALS